MRVFWIVLDSAGVGAAPDAALFDDEGCDTFGNCIRYGKEHGYSFPNMTAMGLGNIQGTSFRDPKEKILGTYMKMQEKSMGKDTTVGHWEMAGMVSERPLPTYPNGFPEEIVKAIEEFSGRKVICNLPYSGTEVLKDYGKQQMEEDSLIVYTSADSVLQIAAHEDMIPVEELYEICKKARELMQGEHGVGRIIARPYVGTYPDLERTVRRHDFSLQPPKETILDAMMDKGLATIGVGKIYDIFAGKGISETYPNQGNTKNMEKTMELMDKDFEGLCYVNLVDFDMIYGHRRDVEGYTRALAEVDVQLGQMMAKMGTEDILIVTADHGCDPAFKGTDHTREFIPCLIYGDKIRQDLDLGCRSTYADMAATIAEIFGLSYQGDGESFWKEIIV